MRIDLYTRMVLTVIAVCLVWLSLGVPSLLTPLSAQSGYERRHHRWLARQCRSGTPAHLEQPEGPDNPIAGGSRRVRIGAG